MEQYRTKDGYFYYTYKIICIISELPYYYFGKHLTKNLSDGYFGSGLRLNRTLKKYGRINFKLEILSFHNSDEEACFEEKNLIGDLYNTDTKWCLNLKEGGSSGKLSDEAIRNMSISLTGREIPSDVRRKISNTMRGTRTGKDNPIHKPGVIERMSNSLKGKKASEETKKKMSQSHIGKMKRGVCKYCGREMNVACLERWHNKNCNSKLSIK